MIVPIEPDLFECGGQFGILEQRHRALDMVPIDMRDDEQFEAAAVRRQGREARAKHVLVRGRTARVDEDLPWCSGAPIANPQAVTLAGWQHLDLEHVIAARGA